MRTCFFHLRHNIFMDRHTNISRHVFVLMLMQSYLVNIFLPLTIFTSLVNIGSLCPLYCLLNSARPTMACSSFLGMTMAICADRSLTVRSLSFNRRFTSMSGHSFGKGTNKRAICQILCKPSAEEFILMPRCSRISTIS